MPNPPFTVVVVTLFPRLYPGPLAVSLSGKALERGLWRLASVALGDHAGSERIDDACFGGGSGQVLRPEPCAAALAQAFQQAPEGALGICPTPRGRPATQKTIRRLARAPGLVFLCGRYEGIDQRVIEACALEELSIGDFVLASGDCAALALIEGVVRLREGVINNPKALEQESFENDLLEYPHYTRPARWRGMEVPSTLLSGNHATIQAWRACQAQKVTRERRPDMWEEYRKKTSHLTRTEKSL